MSEAIGWLLFGGSRSLRTYERAVLEGAASVLEPDVYRVVVAQAAAVRRCQREHQDRMVLISVRDVEPLPADGDVEILRGEVRSSNGDYRAPFSVFMTLGRLRTIEFRKSPKRFIDQPFLVSHRTPPWSRRTEMAEIIDREEHF